METDGEVGSGVPLGTGKEKSDQRIKTSQSG